MNRILQIFKKDVAHLWPQILVFVAALMAFAWVDPPYLKGNLFGWRQILELIDFLLPLSCWLLVTSLVQEEKAVGNQHYWLTRPFSLADLLAAKALFVLAFIFVPAVVCQFLMLSTRLAAEPKVGVLLEKQMFFLAFLLLPSAALASMTKNLGRAFLGGVCLALELEIAIILMLFLAPDAGWGWGALTWIRDTFAAIASTCGAAAVIYLQYARRRTALGRVTLACATVVFAVVWTLAPLRLAFAVQSRFSKRQLDRQAVQISFDPRPIASLAHTDVKRPHAYLEIPIKLENVPADLEVRSEAVFVDSPWQASSSDYWIRRGDSGEDGLVIRADTGYLQRTKDAPVHLRGWVGLSLEHSADKSEWPRCWMVDVYAPYPTSPWFSPWRNCTVAKRLMTPVAHIQRSFDLGPLRLADYVVIR